MRVYARIDNGRVAEIVTTDRHISTLFHPSLIWVDATSVTGVAEGWTYHGSGFSKTIVTESAPRTMSIPEIEAQIAILSAHLEILKTKG